MKTIFTLFLTACFTFCFFTNAETQNDPLLTLIASVNPQGATQLVFEPSGQLDIDYWTKDLIEIQIYIEDESFTRQQLKALVPAGFYKITSSLEGTQLNISMPNQIREVTINGKQVNNSLKFRMKMPQNMALRYPGTVENPPVKIF